jgi:hypothetical protein
MFQSPNILEQQKIQTDIEEEINKGKGKVKVKLSLCLTKHHAMKMYSGMEV